MCLYIRTQDIKDSRLKFKNDKVICYKVLKKTKTYLQSPIQNAQYKAGWKKARGKVDIRDDLSGNLLLYGGAIHVYRSYKKAKCKQRGYLRVKRYVVIPVICYKKDFIAVGQHGEAAFKKVFVRPSDFKEAMNE